MLAADLGGPLTKHPQSLRKEVRTVKRWTILLAGAALWLFLAAIPALADGGPHVMADNSGSSTLTADSCAGCHRAHTAQGAMLLKSSEEDLCLTCHGSSGVGASTDVELGVQFKVALATGSTGQDPTTGSAVLGALRGGGFVTARIDSGNATRVLRSDTNHVFQLGKVRALAVGAPVTSAHLNLPENGLSAPQVAWGNAAPNGGAGPTVTIGCTTCHNPHGNGQYRILNPIPSDDTGDLVEATTSASVTDAALPGLADGARNYTIIQTAGGTGTLLASQAATASGAAGALAGDYWHVRVPWTTSPGTADAPNGWSGTFNGQITAWCKTCHVQYYADTQWFDPNPSGDTLFKYRHNTTTRLACTTCHVAHGSNARMEGTFSRTQPFPNAAAPSYTIGSATTGDSRLLKVDNRGTCQLCHEPTNTVGPGTYTGPTSTPGVP
jgi:predicted CXXCH cytochrome family protein